MRRPVQVGSFQDAQNLYLLMETVMGGELFYYLQVRKGPASVVRTIMIRWDPIMIHETRALFTIKSL